MDEITKIENLLIQIGAINKSYEKIAKLTGENFNIFEVLGLTTNEVRTHSAFIAELLNPKGSHDQNEVFLKLFCEQFKIIDFDVETALVEIEKHTGFINEEYTEGGNIDIIASDANNNAIIIENKIYAPDQKNQLLRYFNYGKKNCKSFKMFYLTLFNDETNLGKNGLEENAYTSISYSHEILTWLEACREKSTNHPILRETITQYINLIKILTNQTTNTIMKEEILAKIKNNSEYIKAYFELTRSDIRDGVNNHLVGELKKQMEELAVELKIDFADDSLLSKNGLGYFTFKIRNSTKGFYLGFGSCAAYHNFFFLVDCNDEYRENSKKEVCERIGNRGKDFDEIWIQMFDNDIRYWHNSYKPWHMIQNGEMKDYVRTKLKHIISSLDGFDL